MSVIIGYKDKNGKVWMAGDRRVTQYTTIHDLPDSVSKIWDDNGVVYGGVGTLTEIQAMRFSHMVPAEAVELDKVDAEFVYDMYPIYAQAALEHKGIKLVDGHGYADFLVSEFLIGCNDRLFCLGQDGSVLEIDDFDAIGCAEDLVRGYILGHQDEEDTEKLLRDAICFAADRNNGISKDAIVYAPAELEPLMDLTDEQAEALYKALDEKFGHQEPNEELKEMMQDEKGKKKKKSKE